MPVINRGISCVTTVVAMTVMLWGRSSLGQRVLHVPGEYPTIQAGIDAAQNNDTVLVAEGTYTGPGNVDLNFGGKAITVRGENSVARISDSSGGTNVVRFHSGETESAVFEGFITEFHSGTNIVIDASDPTIRNCKLDVRYRVAISMIESNSKLSDLVITGAFEPVQIAGGVPTLERVTMVGTGLTISSSTATLTDCSISGHISEAPDLGGGMTISRSTVTLTRCTIHDNSAFGNNGYDAFGGGINATFSTIRLTECTISDNFVFSHFFIDGQGGGVYMFECDATLTDCIFERNRCGTKGGGAYVQDGSALFTNCTFRDNFAEILGGGAYGIGDFIDCRFERNVSLESGGGACSVRGSYQHCTFRDNTTESLVYEDFGGGAGLLSDPGPTIVLDSLFQGNLSNTSQDDAFGGGMRAGANDIIRGCTFVDNFAETAGGGISFEGPNTTMANCILWGNSDQNGLNQIVGPAGVAWCDVQGGYSGEGNIDEDPRFADPTNGDYRLGNASPCIDAGNNDLVPPESEFDLDGNPRFVDDRGMPDMGEGTAPIVDMGCYEFQGRSTGLNLRVSASCPDGGPARFGWANASPAHRAALLFAELTGSFRIPQNQPCAGTTLGLGSRGLRVAWLGMTGPDGQRVINAAAPPGACGGFVQFIDGATCQVSEVAQVE